MSEVLRPRLVTEGGPWVALCPAEPPERPRPPEPAEPAGPAAPLAGVVVAVKDLIAVRGLPCGAGSRTRAGASPEPEDAPVVAALRAAGGVVAGTVALHELAFGVTGINDEMGFPPNPHDPTRIPGGSSSGSAVAVADGSAGLALGTDTGGSVRIPAALCGVVGFKPAYGTLPLAGVLPLAPSLDHVGLLGRSVAEVARAYAVMTGGGPVPDPAPGGRRLRLAVDRAALDAASPSVRARLDTALATVAGAGPGGGIDLVELTDVATRPSPGGAGWPSPDEVFDVSTTILFAEAADVHAALLASPDAGRLGPPVAARLEAGAAVGAPDLAAARQGAARIAADVRANLGRVDAVVGPTVRVTAPTIDAARRDPDLARVLVADTRLANLTGLPALTVPVPGAAETLPVGLQVQAATDAAALAVGTALARRLGGADG